ncbi:MAG: hypothetical protein ACR2PR_01885 [Pseudohongiellaceae bacterium]
MTINNEAQRQDYLHLLDVQPIYPRYRIAGAASSPVYRWPESAASATTPATGSTSGAAHTTAVLSPQAQSAAASAAGANATVAKVADAKAADVKATGGVTGAGKPGRAAQIAGAILKQKKQPAAQTALSAQKLSEKGTSKNQSKAQSGSQAKAQNETQSKDTAKAAPSLVFKLAWYKANEKLAIIDEFPSQQPRPTVQARELLQGILRALDKQTGGHLAEPELFSWPLTGEQTEPDNPQQAARNTLAGFIKHRREHGGVSELLVFSDQLQPLLEADGLTITFTHSLSAVLTRPELKREVWNTLQPLLERLADK